MLICPFGHFESHGLVEGHEPTQGCVVLLLPGTLGTALNFCGVQPVGPELQVLLRQQTSVHIQSCSLNKHSTHIENLKGIV